MSWRFPWTTVEALGVSALHTLPASAHTGVYSSLEQKTKLSTECTGTLPEVSLDHSGSSWCFYTPCLARFCTHESLQSFGTENKTEYTIYWPLPGLARWQRAKNQPWIVLFLRPGKGLGWQFQYVLGQLRHSNSLYFAFSFRMRLLVAPGCNPFQLSLRCYLQRECCHHHFHPGSSCLSHIYNQQYVFPHVPQKIVVWLCHCLRPHDY
jgi:hypothetical protein